MARTKTTARRIGVKVGINYDLEWVMKGDICSNGIEDIYYVCLANIPGRERAHWGILRRKMRPGDFLWKTCLTNEDCTKFETYFVDATGVGLKPAHSQRQRTTRVGDLVFLKGSTYVVQEDGSLSYLGRPLKCGDHPWDAEDCCFKEVMRDGTRRRTANIWAKRVSGPIFPSSPTISEESEGMESSDEDDKRQELEQKNKKNEACARKQTQQDLRSFWSARSTGDVSTDSPSKSQTKPIAIIEKPKPLEVIVIDEDTDNTSTEAISMQEKRKETEEPKKKKPKMTKAAISKPEARPASQISSGEPDPKTLPRVTESMKVSELKLELEYRGLSAKGRKKKDLVDRLGLNSIWITATAEYRYLETLKALLMKEEHERARKESEEKRKKEIEREKPKHTFKSSVHPCLLAPTDQITLSYFGREIVRRDKATCEHCSREGTCVWTCMSCDFDICQSCYQQHITDPKEREEFLEKEAKRKKKEEEERLLEMKRRQKELKEREKQRQKELKEREKQRRIEEQYLKRRVKEVIGHIPEKVKVVSDSNSRFQKGKKGFTVWRSMGYENDGWHSYYGPPDKEFDSSWKTVKEANARAKYVLYYKNWCSLTPEEVIDDDIEESFHGRNANLLQLTLKRDCNETVTVGVVPDSAFEYLVRANMPHDSILYEGSATPGIR